MRAARLLAALILAVAVTTSAHPARAQVPAAAVPDSLPARAGSWALEGGVGTADATLGALRFVAPRAALGVAVVASSGRQTSETAVSSGSGVVDATQRTTSTTLSLDLGYRRYTHPRDALATFVTAGPSVRYVRGTNAGGTAAAGFASRYTQTGAGAFGELGAAYLPARRLSVNASAQLRAARLFGSTRNTTADARAARQASAGRTRGWTAEFGLARLSATLFF